MGRRDSGFFTIINNTIRINFKKVIKHSRTLQRNKEVNTLNLLEVLNELDSSPSNTYKIKYRGEDLGTLKFNKGYYKDSRDKGIEVWRNGEFSHLLELSKIYLKAVYTPCNLAPTGTPPSSDQLRVIGYICSNLGIKFNGETKEDAIEFIDEHIEESKEKWSSRNRRSWGHRDIHEEIWEFSERMRKDHDERVKHEAEEKIESMKRELQSYRDIENFKDYND